MFDFITFPLILTAIVFLIIGTFIGIGLGGRSKVAKAAYDEIRARADRAEEQLREWRASARNKQSEE